MYAVDALKTARTRANMMVEQSKAASQGRNQQKLGTDPAGMFDSMSVFGQQFDAGLTAEQLKQFRGWTYASVKVIAQRVASQPVRIGFLNEFEADEPKLKGAGPSTLKSMLRRGIVPAYFKNFNANDLEIVEQHEILSSISDPNPLMVQWSLLYLTMAHLELTGKSYWWVYDRDGKKEIWPLPPSWVRPVHGDRLFESYVVTPGIGGVGGFTVPAENMVYFAYPDPSDPYGGATSGLQANNKAIAADEAIQDCQKNMFENGIFPGLAIVAGRHPEVSSMPGQRQALDKDQRLELRQAIAAHYRGVTKYGEPLILDAMIEDVKKIQNTANEMDFLNSSRSSKERVLQGWGVSPIVMGDAGNANRASAAVADSVFCSATVNPKIELISQTLTKYLPVVFGSQDEGMVIWIEPARPNDVEQRMKELAMLKDSSALTKNELRTEFGFSPLEEGGDEPISTTPKPAVGPTQEQVVSDSGSANEEKRFAKSHDAPVKKKSFSAA